MINKKGWEDQIQPKYKEHLKDAEAEFLEAMGYAEADKVNPGIFLGAKFRIQYYEEESSYVRSRYGLIVSIDVDLDDDLTTWHASLGFATLDGISAAAYLCFRSYEGWSLYCGEQQYLINFAWL